MSENSPNSQLSQIFKSNGALAEAIESLLLDPNRARTFGEAGREAVRSRFTVERMAREIAAVYEKVCDR